MGEAGQHSEVSTSSALGSTTLCLVSKDFQNWVYLSYKYVQRPLFGNRPLDLYAFLSLKDTDQRPARQK